MNRILPSEAVAAIEALFPFTNAPAQRDQNLPHTYSVQASAALALLDAVPSELLVLPGNEMAELIAARARVMTFVEETQTRGNGAPALRSGDILAIRQLLERCPDQAVPATTAALLFIREPCMPQRASLRFILHLLMGWLPKRMNMGFLSIEFRRTLYHVISIAVLSKPMTRKNTHYVEIDEFMRRRRAAADKPSRKSAGRYRALRRLSTDGGGSFRRRRGSMGRAKGGAGRAACSASYSSLFSVV